jgi:YfiH family protein
VNKRCEYGVAVFEDQFMTESSLPETYPELEFLKLHQIHSDKVLPASSELHQADGHWTRNTKQALLIQTADCMPIVMLGPATVYALHAGWRGIEQNIIGAASQVMRQNLDKPEDFYVFIGPHIQKESFEVGKDVAARLLAALPKGFEDAKARALLKHPENSKAFVDLNVISKAQLGASGFDLNKTWISETDTVLDQNYHSYRREKSSGRQCSFGYKF